MLDQVYTGGVDVDGVGPSARGGHSSTRSQHLDIDSTSLVCPNHMLSHADCDPVDSRRSTDDVGNDSDDCPTLFSSRDGPG